MSELRIVKLFEMNAIKLGLRNDKLYFKSEADKVIAEKDNEITELKADNERLKYERLKYEKRKMYTKMQHDTIVDALCREHRQQLRAERRALWLARAQRANEHYHRYHGKFLCPLEDIPEYVKWKQVERKCRAKAEQYK